MKSNLMIAVLLLSACAFGFDSDTLGYYSFTDGEIGESALGMTITNSVGGTAVAGGAVSSTRTNPSIVFSSERPGKYIYSSSGADAELLTENVQSIRIGGSSIASSGTIVFSGAGAELSRHHDTGFTWEFFVKMDVDDATDSSSPNFINQMFAGNGVGGYNFRLFMPFSGKYVYYDGGASESMPSVVTHDGQWHHFAIVESVAADGSYLAVYCDGVQLTNKKISSTLVAAPTGDILMGNNQFCGALCGVRITKRALSKSEFLVATDRYRPVAPVSEDTIAFYPFDDGTNGASAVGTSILNAAYCGAGAYDGTLQLSTSADAKPSAVFCEERPGKYVYAGGNLIYENPKSVFMTSDSSGKSASITFPGLGMRLSRNHSAGNTVEFFIRFRDENYSAYVESLRVAAGYVYQTSASTSSLYAYFPFEKTTEGKKNLRYCLGYYENSPKSLMDAFVPAKIADGKWHHVAFVESNVTEVVESVRVTTTRIFAYFDYQMCGSIGVGSVRELTSGGDVVLGNFCHHGYYSCFKATGKSLGPDEFMVVRNTDAIATSSETIAFYPFNDRPAGAAALGTTVINGLSSVSYQGTVALSTTAGANSSAVFDSDAPASAIYLWDENGSTAICTNPASVRVTSDVAGEAATITFAGLGDELSRNHANGHTVEYFVKFLDNNFKSYLANFEVAGGYQFKTYTRPFDLYYPFYKNSNITPLCMALGYYGDTPGYTSRFDAELSWSPHDGKWHHVAMVYAAKTITLWIDRKQIGQIAVDNEVEHRPSDDGRTCVYPATWDVILGANSREHAKYSCLKVTNRALGCNEFMRTKPKTGMVLFVR